jgi:hypothetical protein
MNIFIQMLASDSVAPAPDRNPTTFDIEDNVGEAIHIHLRNVRVEMSVSDFETFAEQLVSAREELDDGDR